MDKNRIPKEKLVQILIQRIVNSEFQVDKIQIKSNQLICYLIKLISCKYF